MNRAPVARPVAVGTGALVASLAVWWWMASGSSAGVDLWVHDWSVGQRASWATPLALGVSTIFGPTVESCLVLVVAVGFWSARQRWSAVVLVVACVVTVGVTFVVKRLVGRPRPDPRMWLGPPENAPSFPSGHTLSAAVFLLVAGYLWWRMSPGTARLLVWWAGAVGGTVLVAWSRLYLGVHWFTDTLASVCLSMVVLGGVMTAVVLRYGPPGAKPGAPIR